MGYSVGEVARLSGVTVRTLHHYDALGLLTPTARTDAGYRHYSDEDLKRLQRILSYRELGFDLERIAAILNRSDVAPLDDLRRQHALLMERIGRLQRMLAGVEKQMEATKMGINLSPNELFEVFGESDPTRYAEEAEQRWGETDAYRESQRRTSTYSKDDWLRIKAAQEQNLERFAAAFTASKAATSAEAMDAAEGHRRAISRWFYDCDHEMHRALGDMYIGDPRFTATYEAVAPGLAQYVRDAIHANAERRREHR